MTATITRNPQTDTNSPIIDLRLPQAEVHQFAIGVSQDAPDPDRELPAFVTLLRPEPGNPAQDQLFIDSVPVSRDAFHYDDHDRVLTWIGHHGGGRLHLTHDGQGAVGNVGGALDHTSVQASAIASFVCDVATNAGATYKSSGQGIVGFSWDPSSTEWANADWAAKQLQITYTVHPASPFAPATIDFTFTNLATGEQWKPVGPEATLGMSERDGQITWDLAFKSIVIPPSSISGDEATTPDTVFPIWLQAAEDAAAYQIDGAFEIDKNAPDGTVVALRGVRAKPTVAGYYRTDASAAPFNVFAGQMHVGDQPIPGAVVHGQELHWTDMPEELAAAAQLPIAGSLTFSHDGSVGNGCAQARRLRATPTAQAVRTHAGLHPMIAAALDDGDAAAGAGTLNIQGLLMMTPYAQKNGAWSDQVQGAVRADMSTIMNSFIPADMWSLLFPQQAQTPLTGELAKVASSPVPGVSDPADFYRTLSTAVLTQGMANGSDDACQYMNGPRAGHWLRESVATSKVFYKHSQRLFEWEWQQLFPITDQYVTDQQTNSAKYDPMIDQRIQAAVADITQNVVTNADSPKDLKAKLIADVESSGQYAKTNGLFWAFAFYVYNTAPATLTNIAMQMSTSTGNSDGTTLTRLFQQNAAVLTALDPSGYFARSYTKTLNQFLAVNILPSMYGFTGDATSFDLIKEYLEKFVSTNLNNENQAIAAAAQEIANILAEDNADEMLQASIDALRAFSEAINDTLALPYVAENLVKYLQDKWAFGAKAASLFGGVIMAGVMGLAIFNLLGAFRSWSKLTPGQRAEAIIDAVQLGLQVVAAIVQRGVRAAAIFSADGLTWSSRLGALGKMVITGEGEAVDAGLLKIGNTTARWIGDTEGTVGRVGVLADGEELGAVLVNDVAAVGEEVSWVGKVFGKTLDEFVATRIGPIFILAGIGLSIYFITTGEKGAALASDIINIVGGALMLFAIVGGWILEGAAEGAMVALATMVSFAGPLAIVAALAGIALMLYQMFKKPPDPVQEFVDQYVRPAGLAVIARQTAIDYVQPYKNTDQAGLMMIGMRLENSAGVASVSDDGSVSMNAGSWLPDCVWQVQTDGHGISKFLAKIQPDPSKPPVWKYLSLMTDKTVAFADQWTAPTTANPPTTPQVIATQSWLTAPLAAATLTTDNMLTALSATIGAVIPDADGHYSPGGVSAYLATVGSQLTSAATGAGFEIVVTGMAPNYMAMADMDFILNSTPSTAQTFGPSFGVMPSTPWTFSNSGTLPPFLVFEPTTGTFSPNGAPADATFDQTDAIGITNALGTASASYTVSVAAPTQPPGGQR